MLKNICILRLSALGDVANCLPALRAIQQAYPRAKITWIVGKTEYQLVKDVAKVQWVVVDKNQFFRSWNRLLKLPKFDVVLHMQVSLRASLLKSALKTKRTIGFDKARSKDGQRFFCNELIKPHSEAHTLESYLDFASAIGSDVSCLSWDLSLANMQSEINRIDLPSRYVVISPCSTHKIRNWTQSGYAEVCKIIFEKYGLNVVITGGGGVIERSYGESIVAQNPHAINLVGKTSVRQMVAIIAGADLVIAPDSGPAHIATALSIKVVGLYANTNPKRARAFLSDNLVVNRYPQALRQYMNKRVEEVKFGTRVRHPDVMQLISVDDVMAMVDKALLR